LKNATRDAAIIDLFDTVEGVAALNVIERWGPEGRHVAHLIRMSINRSYHERGKRAPYLGREDA